MHLIALSTSTHNCGVAIGSDREILSRAAVARRHVHDSFLTPAIQFSMDCADLAYSQLAAIVIDVGPGMFTGLRIGIATAKTMALALRIPMIPISSLDLIAFSVRYSRSEICAVIDGRRNEVFTANYRAVPGGIARTTDYRVESPAAVADALVAVTEDVLVVGDGATTYADEFSQISGVTIADIATPQTMADEALVIGSDRFVREDFVMRSDVEPMYLRRPDAEVVRERRLAETEGS